MTLDSGALIALERGDGKLIALLDLALKQGRRFRVPAGVLGQVWRNGQRQAVLARFLRAEELSIVPLDEPLARACGELCGNKGTSDVIDASVVLTARGNDDIIVTADAADLRRLDHKSMLVEI
ncbi:MAG: PIN domain-containing protein [Deltaproteobacteria bacterium]